VYPHALVEGVLADTGRGSQRELAAAGTGGGVLRDGAGGAARGASDLSY